MMTLNTVLLWKLLGSPGADRDALRTQLEALAGAPLTERWPFLADRQVGQLLQHEDAELRALAVRCLAGATGVCGWPLLLSACDDPDAQVRAAARMAFQVSSCADPARMTHLLASTDHSVAAWALEWLPPHFPRQLLFPFLADPKLRARALRAIGPLNRPVYGGALLRGLREGYLSGAEVREAFRTMPWSRSAEAILEAVAEEAWPRAITELVESTPRWEYLREALLEPERGDLGLDQLLDECWSLFQDGGPEGIADGLFDWWRLIHPWHGTLLAWGVALFRAATRRGAWTPTLTAMVATVLPDLLSDELIPLQTRRRGLALMRPLRATEVGARWHGAVTRLIGTSLFRTATGELALGRVAEFPLSEAEGRDLVSTQVTSDALRVAVALDPDGAVALLERAQDWSLQLERELAETVEEEWSGALAVALAETSFQRPIAVTRILDGLTTDRRAEVFAEMLWRLEDRPDAIAHRECQLLADELMRRVTTSTVMDLVGPLRRVQDRRHHPLARRLLHAVARHDMLAWALEDQGSLFGDDALLGAAGRPAPGARKPSGPTHIRDVLPTGTRLEYLALVAPDEDQRVIHPCAEECARLLRADGEDTHLELARYQGRRTVGLVPCLTRRTGVSSREEDEAFGPILLLAEDADDVVFKALTDRHRVLPSGSDEDIAALLRRSAPTTLATGVLASRHGGSDSAVEAVRRWLREGNRHISDFLLLAFRQESTQWLAAALEAMMRIGGSSEDDDDDAEQDRFDSRTGDVVEAILRWSAGEPWRLPGPPPAPVHAACGEDARFTESWRRLLDLSGSRAERLWGELGWRVPFDLAEPMRLLHRMRAVRLRLPGICRSAHSSVDLDLEAHDEDEVAAALAGLRSPDPDRALAAAALLEMRSAGWEEAVTEALLCTPAVPAREGLAILVGRMISQDCLRRLDQDLSFVQGQATADLVIGLGIWEATRRCPAWLARVVAIVDGPLRLSGAQWERLLHLGGVGLRHAELAVTAPEPECHETLVELLLDEKGGPADARHLLRRFLLECPAADYDLRRKVAEWLARRGCGAGAPLLVSRKLPFSSADVDDLALGALTEGELEAVVESALMAGGQVLGRHLFDTDASRPHIQSWLPTHLARAPHRKAVIAACLQRIACDSDGSGPSEEALAKLRDVVHAPHMAAELIAALDWGEATARRLTGHRFRIELLGGDQLGYTPLRERRIFVSPLPLLRGDAHSDDIFRGLILHELGHQVHHTSSEWLGIAEQAEQDGLGRLLNLVADEHLERNLRSRSPEFGRCLARLVAYAFQHARREVPVTRLLDPRAGVTLATLRGLTLAPAREAGHVALQVGETLLALEGQGSSLARFVRALRMGLGNRHGDPAVGRALALFRRDFRCSTGPEHLRITRELRQIFRHELPLLEWLRLDQLLETTAAALREAGIDGEWLRWLRTRPGQSTRPGASTPNREDRVDFDPIPEVVQLKAEATSHATLASQVRVPASELRRYLLRMGLGTTPVRRRMRGKRVDRPGLARAVAVRDPRLLMHRRRVQAADLFLGVVVDCSGSMEEDGRIERARLCATMVAEACRGLPGVDLRIFGFTNDTLYDAGTAERCAAHAFHAGGGNNDAGALWHAAQLAGASRRSARLLLMISDGIPTGCSVAALTALVRRLERQQGFACAQVAVHPISDRSFERYVEITESESLAMVGRFGRVLAELTEHTVGRR